MISAPLIIDTFTAQPGSGNPTAVCFINEDVTNADLQQQAAVINLPVTAFIIEPAYHDNHFHIRYFTPTTEIPACGHATLAAAKIVFENHNSEKVSFQTISGLKIDAAWMDEKVWLRYPVYRLQHYAPTKKMMLALGLTDYHYAGICVELESVFIELPNENVLRSVNPDYALMMEADPAIKEVVIMCGAKHSSYDFLLRSFCPWIGIDEDPVTGSVHSVLAGFWSDRLNKRGLVAYQASSRGGEAFVKAESDHVLLGGCSVIVNTK